MLSINGERFAAPEIRIFRGRGDRYAVGKLSPRPEEYAFTYVGPQRDGQHLDYVFDTVSRAAGAYAVTQVTIDGLSFLPSKISFRTKSGGVVGSGQIAYAKADKFWMPTSASARAEVSGKARDRTDPILTLPVLRQPAARNVRESAGGSAITMAKITVEVTGDFLVESSLARVNRGIFGAMAGRDDIELGILGEPTAAQLSGTKGDEFLESRRKVRFYPEPDVTIRHRWPPVFPRIASGAYVHMQPWEFGNIPKEWARELGEIADDVWCYSEFVAAMYRRAGIPEERVHVIPLGIDPQVFSPGLPPASTGLAERCVFLYVGDTIERKGIDVAVEAYRQAFGPGDQVALVVKDFGAKMPGEAELRDRVRALAEQRGSAPIVYMDASYTDAALAGLYRTAAAVVAPYRGEGFGLPVLEAMACGTPPIVTRGGATDDFTSEQMAYLIDAERVELGKTYRGFELVDEAFWLEPSLEAVKAAMRDVYENRNGAREKGRRASETAYKDWTWARGAERAAERIKALAGGKTFAGGRAPAAGELRRFELKIASRGGEDGVLLELFRRLGVVDPSFVELVPSGEEPVTTVFLARALAWRGVVMQAGAAVYAQLEQLLAQQQVPSGFELLALPPGAGAAGTPRRLPA